MAYQKVLVDNTTCSRRFHITFDNAAEELPRVELRCQFCDAVIFAENNHPPVTLAREENLVKTAYLSEHTTTECHLEDVLSKRTQPLKHDEKAPPRS